MIIRLMLTTSIALAMAPNVVAQTSNASTTTEAEGETRRLGAVTVQAQRREQDILDVPVAVTSIGAEALKAGGIDSVKDLTEASPSVFINELQERTGNVPIRIRGIGTVGSNPAFEGAVGVYIDDVYRSRGGMAFASFMDMEGVEVLRGPQGTLFGKNTVAGALVLNTAKPDFDAFGARIEAAFSEYDTQRFEGFVNVPLADGLAVRLSAMSEEGDGFYELPSGEPTQPADLEAFRVQLAFELNDKFSGRLVLDQSTAGGPFGSGRSTRLQRDNPEDPSAILQETLYPLLALTPALGGTGSWYWDPSDPTSRTDPFSRVVSINTQNTYEAEDQGLQLDLNYDLSSRMSLRSITSYREFEEDSIGADWDFGPVDIGNGIDLIYDFETFSQEFILDGSNSLGEQSLDWVIGAHYFNESWTYDRDLQFGQSAGLLFATVGDGLIGIPGFFDPATAATPGVDVISSSFTQDEESFGWFGHGTWNITDQWSVTGGLRYNRIEKSTTNTNNLGDPVTSFLRLLNTSAFATTFGLSVPGRDFAVETEDEEPTYSLALQYRPNDRSQLYASYARGFKAGGVNLNPDAGGLAPNLVAGTPTELAPGLFVPLSPIADPSYAPEFVDAYEIGYRHRFDNAMLSVTAFRSEYEDLQISVFTGTAFEIFNAGTSTSQGLELEGTVSMTDNLTLNGGLTWLETAEYGDDVIGPPAGRRRGQAPEIAVALGGQYERPLTDTIDVYANGLYAYNSEFFLTDEGNGGLITEVQQEGYGILNGAIGLREVDNWDIQLFCTNCLDEDYFTYAFNQPFYFGAAPAANPAAPRSAGVRLAKTF